MLTLVFISGYFHLCSEELLTVDVFLSEFRAFILFRFFPIYSIHFAAMQSSTTAQQGKDEKKTIEELRDQIDQLRQGQQQMMSTLQRLLGLYLTKYSCIESNIEAKFGLHLLKVRDQLIDDFGNKINQHNANNQHATMNEQMANRVANIEQKMDEKFEEIMKRIDSFEADSVHSKDEKVNQPELSSNQPPVPNSISDDDSQLVDKSDRFGCSVFEFFQAQKDTATQEEEYGDDVFDFHYGEKFRQITSDREVKSPSPCQAVDQHDDDPSRSSADSLFQPSSSSSDDKQSIEEDVSEIRRSRCNTIGPIPYEESSDDWEPDTTEAEDEEPLVDDVGPKRKRKRTIAEINYGKCIASFTFRLINCWLFH